MSEKTNNLLHLFSKILRNPKFMMAIRMDMMSEKLRSRKNRNGAQGLLMELWKKDGLTNAEIAEILDIKPSSVTAQVKNLESQGLVERRQDENDKRVSRVFLTENGQAAQEKREDLHDNITTDLFDELTEEEQETLADLLQKLLDSNTDFEFDDFGDFHHFGDFENRRRQFFEGFGGPRGPHAHGGHGNHREQMERWQAMSDDERRQAMQDSMPFGEDWKKLFDLMKNRHNPWDFGGMPKRPEAPKPPRHKDADKADDWTDF